MKKTGTSPRLPARQGFPSLKFDGLTPREQNVVLGILKGLTDKEIAGSLGVSVHTVRQYLKGIRWKLSAHTRGGIIGRLLAASSQGDGDHPV